MKSLPHCLLLMAISTVACAAVDLPPASLRDKGKIPTSVVRYGIRGDDCNFKYTDPYFGYLSNQEYINNEKFPLHGGGGCYDTTPPFKDISGVARYDEPSKQWTLNTAFKFYDLADNPKESLYWETKAAKSIHFYPLNNINSQGFAYTQDAITGDEDHRERILHYCLVKPPKALCGQGVMGSLNTIKKNDLTSYALKILRSIEFIEDEFPSGSADPQARPQ